MAMYAIIDIFVLGPTFDDMPDEIIVDMIALKSKVVKFFLQFTKNSIKTTSKVLIVNRYHIVQICCFYHNIKFVRNTRNYRL